MTPRQAHPRPLERLPVPLRFVVAALLVAVVLVRLTHQPTYTDAFYHFNAATRLASGLGLTDAYLWNYIGARDVLPQPSHLYWMPFTSLTAAAGMTLLGAPGDHRAAQILFIPMLAATGCIGFWLGRQLGGGPRQAWLSGLLTLFSGFFVAFWGAIDTFTPYAFVGSAYLLAMGLAITRGKPGWWLMAGVLGGLGHLTRADGLLLPVVGILMAFWPWSRATAAVRAGRAAVIILGYILVMGPWFARNLDVIGSPLPLGGTQAIWFTNYDELFSYPPDAGPATLFADGPGAFLRTRAEALSNNIGTLIVVEGMVILTPFMLLGLWRKRRESMLRPFWIYALGLHAAMTLVFPLPGYRGGLFHSAAALIPFWMSLSTVGIDSAVDAIARRRRHWRPTSAKWVFSAGILMLAVALSLFAVGRSTRGNVRGGYSALEALLPPSARVMANDPAAIYYATGRGGVVLPNEAPEVIQDIARRYDIDYLLLEFEVLPDGTQVASIPVPLDPLLERPPAFLREIPLPANIDMRLYVIDH